MLLKASEVQPVTENFFVQSEYSRARTACHQAQFLVLATCGRLKIRIYNSLDRSSQWNLLKVREGSGGLRPLFSKILESSEGLWPPSFQKYVDCVIPLHYLGQADLN